ncbi:MAG: IS21 family transposase [Actinobacteria bacterium]|nr:IS21 family transposase [Actinomycetota bacterium]MCA1707267.1 IS21 family transposase [Actinomycetota bacterium]
MYSVHDWAEVHRLHEREGWSKTAIARRLSMSRNTVDRLLRLEDPPRYGRRTKGSLLDSFRLDIAEMLDSDAGVPATVILDHLQARGYEGRITILKDYLQQERPRYLARRSFQRTSYVPGEIGQFDWWDLPITIPVGKNRFRKPHGLVATLPHSAAHETVFTFTKTMGDFCPAFVQSLERFGGVPTAGVFDNDSSIIAKGSGKNAVLHDEVAALFGHLALKPIILEKERPESKGQVERTVGYLETSFLPLRSFSSIEDLQDQHDTWVRDKAHPRHHRRVGARVSDAYNVERGYLHPLPVPLPDTDFRFETKATKDLFIRVFNADYSLPPGLCGRRLSVKTSLQEVVIYLEGAEIARHIRSYVPADVVLDPAHARALRLARAAKHHLCSGDVDIEIPDLSRYDELLGAST